MTDSTPGTYASTVLAPAQIALGFAFGIGVAAILEALQADLWPVAIVVVVGFAVLGYLLSGVSLAIGHARITIGQGRWEREPRIVHASEVRQMEGRDLTWLQCFGVGIEDDEKTTRLSVRPGPTLILTLYDGEQIRISTPDPATAMDLIDEARQSS